MKNEQVFIFIGNNVKIRKNLETSEVLEMDFVLGFKFRLRLSVVEKCLIVQEETSEEFQNFRMKVKEINLANGDVFQNDENLIQIENIREGIITYLLNGKRIEENLENLKNSSWNNFHLKKQGQLWMISNPVSFFQLFRRSESIKIRKFSKYVIKDSENNNKSLKFTI
jgi:hypothetical protein